MTPPLPTVPSKNVTCISPAWFSSLNQYLTFLKNRIKCDGLTCYMTDNGTIHVRKQPINAKRNKPMGLIPRDFLVSINEATSTVNIYRTISVNGNVIPDEGEGGALCGHFYYLSLYGGEQGTEVPQSQDYGFMAIGSTTLDLDLSKGNYVMFGKRYDQSSTQVVEFWLGSPEYPSPAIPIAKIEEDSENQGKYIVTQLFNGGIPFITFTYPLQGDPNAV